MANTTTKEFLQELNSLGVALTDTNKLLIGRAIPIEIPLPPGVFKDGDTAIAVNDSGKVCKFDWFHNQIITSRGSTYNYFFDQEAVREKHSREWWHESVGPKYMTPVDGSNDGGKREGNGNPAGRNIRSVWNIATRPYPGQHYAVFPPDLVYPCIKSGTSEYGVCEACGAPWERVVERTAEPQANGKGSYFDKGKTGSRSGGDRTQGGERFTSRTVGWQPTCSCNGEYIKEPYGVSVVNRETGEPETFTRYRSVYVPAIPLSEHPVVPATVLDPFMGSGTTALAARKLGRRSIGFDLDVRNIKQIEERLGWQGVMF